MTNQEFFVIPREEVLERIPESTIEFYGESDYMDLTKGDLHVMKSTLVVNYWVRNIALHDLGLHGFEDGNERKDDNELDNISYNHGSFILQNLGNLADSPYPQGLRLPSVALMYRVIIPHLKDISKEDEESRRILQAMASDYGEFLEDIIVQPAHKCAIISDRNFDYEPFHEACEKPANEAFALKLQINGIEIDLELPHKVRSGEDGYRDFWDYEVNGSFDLTDLSAFGFPTSIKETGEFKYWGPNDFNIPIGKELYPYGGGPQGEVVSLRQKGDLGLNLLFRRDGFNDNIGVRGVKVE